MGQVVQIGLGDDGRLKLKTQYDKRVIRAIKSLGDHRTWGWDGKYWHVVGSRLLDLIVALNDALPADTEIGVSNPLYVLTDCPTNGHTTRGFYTDCPECKSTKVTHRAGKFVESSRVECIAQCFEATGDECNCLCLGLCHGAGMCLGPHKESEWGKTVHWRRN
jgi:hypothetical protein